MKHKLRLTVVTCLAYCIDKELGKASEYLKEQVRVLGVGLNRTSLVFSQSPGLSVFGSLGSAGPCCLCPGA